MILLIQTAFLLESIQQEQKDTFRLLLPYTRTKVKPPLLLWPQLNLSTWPVGARKAVRSESGIPTRMDSTTPQAPSQTVISSLESSVEDLIALTRLETDYSITTTTTRGWNWKSNIPPEPILSVLNRQYPDIERILYLCILIHILELQTRITLEQSFPLKQNHLPSDWIDFAVKAFHPIVYLAMAFGVESPLYSLPQTWPSLASSR